MYGELVKLLEVVGGEVEVFAPVETQPAQVFLDGADELFIFLGGIRVVEAQMTGAAIFFSDAKVDEGRLGMTDVQLAVRFRREAGDYPTLEPIALHVRLNGGVNKIGGGSSLGSWSSAWSWIEYSAWKLCNNHTQTGHVPQEAGIKSPHHVICMIANACQIGQSGGQA